VARVEKKKLYVKYNGSLALATLERATINKEALVEE